MEKKKDFFKQAKEKVVKTIDKTGDGKIGMDDLGLDKEQIEAAKDKLAGAAAAAGQKLKDAGDWIGDAVDEQKEKAALKALRPVFAQDIRTNNISVAHTGLDQMRTTPELIRIVDRDKEHDAHEVCEGSIGYMSTVKGTDILNVYKDCAKQLGVFFFPTISNSFYYIDPFKGNCYVCLDNYFAYLKKERVSELERIATALGAKSVEIKYKEQKRSVVKQNAAAKIGLKVGKKSGGDLTQKLHDEETASVEIEADVKLDGHDCPKKPELTYFKYDSDINNLIKTQTESGENKIKSKTYTFRCSETSGISNQTALKIDAVLQQLKCAGSVSVSHEAQKENRTVLEYHIEF